MKQINDKVMNNSAEYKMKKDSVATWMKRESVAMDIDVKSIVFDNSDNLVCDILSDRPVLSKGGKYSKGKINIELINIHIYCAK